MKVLQAPSHLPVPKTQRKGSRDQRPCSLRGCKAHPADAKAMAKPPHTHDALFRTHLQESVCAVPAQFCHIRNDQVLVAIATTISPAVESCHCHMNCALSSLKGERETTVLVLVSKICCEMKTLVLQRNNGVEYSCIFTEMLNNQLLLYFISHA